MWTIQRILVWLREDVFPEAVQARAFGAEWTRFISFEPTSLKGVDHFASDVIFGDVTLENGAGHQEKVSVVIKVQLRNETAHNMIRCDSLFSNEMLFYTEIIPLLQKYDAHGVLSKHFPEFIFGKATKGEKPNEDIIILRDLKEKGFRLTTDRAFLDEKHIKLALDRLAKFHALSFKCQRDDPKTLERIASKIQNPFVENPHGDNDYLAISAFRGIEPLKNDPEYDGRLDDICKNCEKASVWYRRYCEPTETINVLTHGDFHRNNMMFRYSADGQPEEVIFFDMATIKFCSPAIDTSAFLFLNTSPGVRKAHWDSFIRIYYDSLSQELNGHPSRPTFDLILKEFQKKGVYGYYLSSFFLPMMLDAHTQTLLDNYEWDSEHLSKKITELGGSDATQYISDIVRHMLDNNFIFEY